MWLLLILLFGLLAMSVPIGVALGIASAAYILIYTNMNPAMIPQSFFFFIDSYTFMAVPFFMFAGYAMERTGLIDQLFDFASTCLGWVKVGLGVATVYTCMILAAITGSSVAEASVMSAVAVPRMREKGYPDRLAAGIVCAGGSLGQLIPPSIWMILYGLITETSIVSLFFAGIIPGIILSNLLVVTAMVYGYRAKLAVIPFDLKKALRGLKAGIVGLGMPVIVLGGLYGGVFTPTEAGAVAAAYAVCYGLVTRRWNFLKELIPVTVQSLRLTAMVFFLVGSVGIFQAVAANEYWPQKFAQAVTHIGLSNLQFIFLYMFVLLILGCFLDGAAMILLTVPVIFPIAQSLGVNPIHLGILLVINCEVGVITPPVGLNLFAVSGISKIPINEVLMGSIPFVITILLFLVLLVFYPEIATWLPGLMFKPVIFGG